jgi:ATP-dependent DNA ligase
VPAIGPGWLHEIKHDGFRVIARKDGPRVRLYGFR